MNALHAIVEAFRRDPWGTLGLIIVIAVASWGVFK